MGSNASRDESNWFSERRQLASPADTEYIHKARQSTDEERAVSILLHQELPFRQLGFWSAVERDKRSGAKILVVADLEYLRDGIQALLEADGYHVIPARGVRDATEAALNYPPDLILVTLDLAAHDMAAAARRIRKDSGIDSTIPILLFCIPTVCEGDDAPLGDSTWAAHLADFNQLREILRKLLAVST
jgi:CheY-like chemotaxis protein